MSRVSSELLIGAIVDSPLLERWKVELLDRIIEIPGTRLSLIVLLEGTARAVSLQLRAYRRLDRALFGRIARRGDPLRRESIDTRLVDADRVILRGSASTASCSLDAGTLRAISNAKLDVLLDLCDREVGAPVTASALGVWRLEHGADPNASSSRAYLGELWEGRTTMRATLRIRSREQPQGRTAARAVWRTYPLSLYVNQVRAFARSGALVCDVLGRVRRSEQPAWPLAPEALDEKTACANAVRASPIALAARTCSRIARRIIHRLRHREEWVLHSRPYRSGRVPWDATFGGKPLIAPAGHFYADPFLCKNVGVTYLFFEDYRFEERKAVISYVRIDAAGNTSEPRVALERPYHLSYPFVFEHQQAFYMIPETLGNRRVELFRAHPWPHAWEEARVLVDDIAAVDSTVFEHEGRYWLMLGRCHDDIDEAEELCAFWSERPFGPWRPHSHNPLMRDVRCARPAGAAFRENDALILPLQDGALRYGHRIRFVRVDDLTPTSWAWTEVGRLEPESIPGARAVHTYSRSDDLEVVDTQLLVRRF